MVSSVCGGNQVRSNHGGGSSIVWGCTSAADIGELQFIEGTMNTNMYCNILKQSMIPSLWRPGHRAVFQYDNNPKHTSKMTTALLKKLRVKIIYGASSNGRWRRAMWKCKRTSMATSEALVNSMPKRVKSVLENNGGHAKY